MTSFNDACGFKKAYSDSVFDGNIQTFDLSMTWRSFRQGKTYHRRATGLVRKRQLKCIQNRDEKGNIVSL